MRIAVTGGSGRIGQAVIDLAARRDHHPVNLDRVPPHPDTPAAAAPFERVEVTDYDAVERAVRGCDALVHLAAIPQPGGHPDHVVHNANVAGSYNALRAAAVAGVRRVC